MSETLSHSRPTLGGEEAAAAQRVILSGQVAQGAEVAALERQMASLTGRRHAIAVSSGTAGLHLALQALGVGAGDGVLMPSYVCGALVHAAAAVRAVPVLCDISPDTRNLDPGDAARRLTPGTRALIVPHMFGLPAQVAELGGLGLPTVEDCAMCLGTEVDGHPVGSLGAVSVCSLYATKVLTAGGEGGMVLTDSGEVAERVRSAREYDHLTAATPRLNYKMTDVAAAVGRVQVGRLPGFVARRRQLSARYDAGLGDTGLSLPPRRASHMYYRYVVGASMGVDGLSRAMAAAGIQAPRPVFTPLHRDLGLADEQYPEATRAWSQDLSLPIYPDLTDDQADGVIRAVRQALGVSPHV